MNLVKHLIEGVKMVALLGAIALVVGTMPEPDGLHAQSSTEADPPANSAK